MGEKSKIILTGDIQQIDNNFLNPVDNGLSIVVEKFKEYFDKRFSRRGINPEILNLIDKYTET